MLKIVFLSVIVFVIGVLSVMSAFMKKPEYTYDDDVSV